MILPATFIGTPLTPTQLYVPLTRMDLVEKYRGAGEAALAGVQAAYRLFGLLPDSIDLRHTMIDLLTEQVAEQPELGVEVMRDIRMIIHVVAREIGEGAGVDAHTVEPELIEAMR